MTSIIIPTDYGIDTLELRFPIYNSQLNSAEMTTSVKTLRGGREIITGKLHIGESPQSIQAFLSSAPYGETFCTLHFNPAKFVDPLGIGLCRPRDLYHVIESVVELLKPHLAVDWPIGEMTVRRMDIARNLYEIPDPGRYILGLAQVPRPWARRTGVFLRDGVLETLQSGSKSGMVRLYDKSREAPFATLPGTLRVELEARGRWLERHGDIFRVKDIDRASMNRLVRSRILNWFGLEGIIMQYEDVCSRLIDAQLSPTKTVHLLKFLLDTRRGLDVNLSSRTIADYRRHLKELGIAGCVELKGTSSATRLDLRSGTEVMVA